MRADWIAPKLNSWHLEIGFPRPRKSEPSIGGAGNWPTINDPIHLAGYCQFPTINFGREMPSLSHKSTSMIVSFVSLLLLLVIWNLDGRWAVGGGRWAVGSGRVICGVNGASTWATIWFQLHRESAALSRLSGCLMAQLSSPNNASLFPYK